MSITYSIRIDGEAVLAEELREFLIDEHIKNTGIPVHPFSVVNADMQVFNRSLGITNGDNSGWLFVEDGYMTAYGADRNHYGNMIAALKRCGVSVAFWS